ncbi:uncharacterized protein LOC122076837 [Macadamia integrifolia]|uniref:uncharacterized protein LOC122076837 n=1 Tax=Macadamia integrifolia TaxID=60698 RepID=UPI001C4E8383|nr:uncharacterized protein LOC122076837 [Macadamia integrifolia]
MLSWLREGYKCWGIRWRPLLTLKPENIKKGKGRKKKEGEGRRKERKGPPNSSSNLYYTLRNKHKKRERRKWRREEKEIKRKLRFWDSSCLILPPGKSNYCAAIYPTQRSDLSNPDYQDAEATFFVAYYFQMMETGAEAGVDFSSYCEAYVGISMGFTIF